MRKIASVFGKKCAEGGERGGKAAPFCIGEGKERATAPVCIGEGKEWGRRALINLKKQICPPFPCTRLRYEKC